MSMSSTSSNYPTYYTSANPHLYTALQKISNPVSTQLPFCDPARVGSIHHESQQKATIQRAYLRRAYENGLIQTLPQEPQSDNLILTPSMSGFIQTPTQGSLAVDLVPTPANDSYSSTENVNQVGESIKWDGSSRKFKDQKLRELYTKEVEKIKAQQETKKSNNNPLELKSREEIVKDDARLQNAFDKILDNEAKRAEQKYAAKYKQKNQSSNQVNDPSRKVEETKSGQLDVQFKASEITILSEKEDPIKISTNTEQSTRDQHETQIVATTRTQVLKDATFRGLKIVQNRYAAGGQAAKRQFQKEILSISSTGAEFAGRATGEAIFDVVTGSSTLDEAVNHVVHTTVTGTISHVAKATIYEGVKGTCGQYSDILPGLGNIEKGMRLYKAAQRGSNLNEVIANVGDQAINESISYATTIASAKAAAVILAQAANAYPPIGAVTSSTIVIAGAAGLLKAMSGKIASLGKDAIYKQVTMGWNLTVSLPTVQRPFSHSIARTTNFEMTLRIHAATPAVREALQQLSLSTIPSLKWANPSTNYFSSVTRATEFPSSLRQVYDASSAFTSFVRSAK